jgi:hypothetical protein
MCWTEGLFSLQVQVWWEESKGENLCGAQIKAREKFN